MKSNINSNFNTDGRTDGLTKMKIAEDIILAVVTARGAAKNGEFCA